MGYLLIILAILAIAIATPSPGFQKVQWTQVSVKKGYSWMPNLHGNSSTCSIEQGWRMEWFVGEDEKFFTYIEDQKFFIKAFVENQQMYDGKEWYLTTLYILEKEGYHYL